MYKVLLKFLKNEPKQLIHLEYADEGMELPNQQNIQYYNCF